MGLSAAIKKYKINFADELKTDFYIKLYLK